MINYDFPYAYENKLYHTLAFENQARGYKLYKASVDAGFTCPNLDGSRGTGGCIFCSGGSGYFTAASEVPLEDQLRCSRSNWDCRRSTSAQPASSTAAMTCRNLWKLIKP